MVWCSNCDLDVDVDDTEGVCCCLLCGRVLDEDHFASDLQFTKGADGEGQMVGHMVGETGNVRGMARYTGGRMLWSQGDSHEAAVHRGRAEISSLVDALHVTPSQEAVESSHRLYRLALQRGFTRGRRLNQVAAACLYIVCRQDKRPYMLIDFSDHLCINIYTLGAVYLQLLRLLRLDDCPAFTKPIDPSLYVHRFVDRLKLGAKKSAVESTCLKLVQSMKRDWMQTGRRPSGICGAALFIAAHIHGCECTKRDIIAVVHVGWHTVEKRVVEFAHSEAGDMTIADFEAKAAAFQQERERLMLEYEQRVATGQLESPPAAPPDSSQAEGADGEGQVVDAEQARLARLKERERTGSCEHVDCGAKPFAYGMCRSCFEDYLLVSGGVEEGADPPAYTRGILTEIRKQVLALPLPPLPRSGLLQLADASEQLLLADGQNDDGASQQDEDDMPGIEELDAVLGREDLGRATRALAGAKAADLPRDHLKSSQGGSKGASGSKRAAVSVAEAAAPAAAAPAESEASGLRRSKRLKAGSASVGGSVKNSMCEVSSDDDEEEAVNDTPKQKGKSAQPAASSAPAQPASSSAPAQAAASQAQSAGQIQAVEQSGQVSTQETAAETSQQPAGDEPAAQASTQGEAGQQQGTEPGAIVLVPGSGAEGEEGTALAEVPEAVQEERVDRLSDVDDEDVDVYIASAEEAEVKGMLWEELNKDWLAKQAAKAAAKAAQEAAGIVPKPKRAPNKNKNKDQPPAESAERAAKSMLEAKKLSHKVNYKALEDLFKDSTDGQEDASGAGEQSAQPESPSRRDGEDGGGGGGLGAGLDDLPVTTVTDAIKRRAAARAAEQKQDASRYALQLQAEQSKRGGAMGGIFLGSLSFAGNSAGKGAGAGAGAAASARGRPSGLGSLRK